jgi:hypothetical protein
MYIGDGAKLVRDAFDLAKEKILKEGRKVWTIFHRDMTSFLTNCLYYFQSWFILYSRILHVTDNCPPTPSHMYPALFVLSSHSISSYLPTLAIFSTSHSVQGAIIFIDELDAIGTKRYGGEQSGDREVKPILQFALRYTTLRCTAPYYTLLRRNVLRCTISQCALLYCDVLLYS